MKVTVKQLKALIREAAEEAMAECGYEEETVKEAKKEEEEEVKKESTEEAALQEAVVAAYRAGLRRGRATATRRR
jgi:hypothetical protein